MSKILVTGIATLDIINQLDHYPLENEEIRATAQTISTGGNACNTAYVLTQLQHHVELAASLGNDHHAKWIKKQLTHKNIGTQYCSTMEGISPISCITLNKLNGSRTIIHYRDLPELNFIHFEIIPFHQFNWLHFEGRNIQELVKMLSFLKQHQIRQPVSIEIEKERENIDHIFRYADVLIYSRKFVQGRGFKSAELFLQEMHKTNAHATHVCPWGEAGAWAIDHSGEIFFSPAYTPQQVIDTLGAGDTFNAGLINELVSGQPIQKALVVACQLAGKKVGQYGLNNLY